MTTAVDANFEWIELAAKTAGGQMVRNHFVRAADAAATEAWRKAHKNTDVYSSVCTFGKADRSCPAGFTFFFDIDANDLEVARQDALKAIGLLGEHLGIAPACIELRFSGAKGYHLLIPSTAFGGPLSAADLPVCRCLAGRLAREGVSHIDQAVYQHSRVLRLVNSINLKTGLYDIPLDVKELADLGLAYVLETARKPREWDSMASAEDCPRAADWLFRARQWWQANRSKRSRSISAFQKGRGWRFPPCVRLIERSTLPDGVRHALYFELGRFYISTGMAKEEAWHRLKELDDRNPIRDPDYIERIVQSADKYAGMINCWVPALSEFCNRDQCFCAKVRPPSPTPVSATAQEGQTAKPAGQDDQKAPGETQ